MSDKNRNQRKDEKKKPAQKASQNQNVPQGNYPGASETNNPSARGQNRPTTPEGGNNG